MSLLKKSPTKDERIEAALRADCTAILAKHGEDLAVIEGILARVRALPNTATPADVGALYAEMNRFQAAVGGGSGGDGSSTGFFNLVVRLRRAAGVARELIEKEDAEAAAAAKAAEDARLAAIAAKEARRAKARELAALREEFPDEFDGE